MSRRLWRDLGFVEPQPAILPFLPSLVVAWADDAVGARENERILSHCARLPKELRTWVEERLAKPPGPYFRYQVLHLLAFLICAWKNESGACGSTADWAERGEAWARELLQAQGWMRRVFGGVSAEREELEALHDVLQAHDLMTTDRIWSLARGAHAEGQPRHVVVVHEDHDQHAYGMAVVLEGADERIAVGCFGSIVPAEDLGEDEVRATLARTQHLHEAERWAAIAEILRARGRDLTSHQLLALRDALEAQLGCPFEEVEATELSYLEDALAADARWMSWIPGKVEELCIDRGRVFRGSAPGTFNATRDDVTANVAKSTLRGVGGVDFRLLEMSAGGRLLRLACPVITVEPPTPEGIALLARLLPAVCDPCQQLVLVEDEGGGTHWVAEVHSALPNVPCATVEPLPPGRSLLVPPWVWHRAARALGLQFFSGRRKVTPEPVAPSAADSASAGATPA